MSRSTSSSDSMAPSNGSTKPIGAVVVGGDYQGLGIVRSLGRWNVPVCIVDDERSIARFSRYATHAVAAKNLRDQRQTIETLLEVGRHHGLEGWLLYPTRDETVAALSRYKSELTKFFRVPTPEWKTIQWVWDKRNTYRLASELGIPVPATWYPRSIEDLEQISAEPPYVLKPAIKEQFVYATKAKAWRANSQKELRALFTKASLHLPLDEVMIQDLIPGGGEQQFAYCAFFRNGRAVGSMTTRRRRQHPPEFGRASTFVETVDLPILEDLSTRFLRAIDYYGLVEVEYKLDTRDGQYRLLDVNGRTWGYNSLGYGAGVDFPYLLYADQTGQTVEECRGRPGVRWIRLLTDTPTAILEILRGRQDLPSYLRSLRNFDVEAVLSSDDLLPGIVELALIPYLTMKRGF